MSETVIVHSLNLMEAYWSISVSSPWMYCSSYSSFVPFNQSSVINKDCTECLYSSQYECLSRYTDLQNSKGIGACKLPTCHQPPPSITTCNSFSASGPSAQVNTIEQLLSPPEIKELLLPLLTGRSSV